MITRQTQMILAWNSSKPEKTEAKRSPAKQTANNKIQPAYYRRKYDTSYKGYVARNLT